MADREILEIVDPTALNRIKSREEHPVIKVFRIGHEGPATFNLPGIGQKTFTWIQAAVHWIANKLHIGTPVFDRHNPDTNSHEGRVTIGEVVGKTVQVINDKLSTLAAIYIYPQYRGKQMDVASIEAEISYDHDFHETWPTGVHNITGIALSNAGLDQPGFPGATLLGAVQAFIEVDKAEHPENWETIQGGNPMTSAEVKAAIQSLGLKPSQVFQQEDLVKDEVVVKYVRDEKHDIWNKNVRLEGEIDELKTKMAKKDNEIAETLRTAKKETTVAKSRVVVEQLAGERKLTDIQKKYVLKDMVKFSSEATDEDSLKVDLNKFIDNELKDMTETAALFGAKIDQSTGNTDKGGTGDNDEKGKVDLKVNLPPVSETEKLADPNVNPLIPGGKAYSELTKTT